MAQRRLEFFRPARSGRRMQPNPRAGTLMPLLPRVRYFKGRGFYLLRAFPATSSKTVEAAVKRDSYFLKYRTR